MPTVIYHNSSIKYDNIENCKALIDAFCNEHIIPTFDNIDIVENSDAIGRNIYFLSNLDDSNLEFDDMVLSFNINYNIVTYYSIVIKFEANLKSVSRYSETTIEMLRITLSQFFNMEFYPFFSQIK